MDGDIASNRLPGGNLVAAALDRRVMGLADKGGASGLVGQRWADISARETAEWVGRLQRVPGTDQPFTITRVARLDDVPDIAATAARRKLQNPDILLIGEHDGHQIIQAMDAKFSVETARARQVSSEVTSGLLTLHDLLLPLTGALADEPWVVDGVFLCPDFPLTHLMFRQRQGIVRPTVRPSQVVLLPAPPDEFFIPVEGASIIPHLERVDRLPVRSEASLLAGLYYFRLARAALGIRADESSPLLLDGDRVIADPAEVAESIDARADRARSAWTLLLDWDRDADTIRNQRLAVEQVAGLPIASRDLRERIERVAVASGREAPSVNRVRRRLGSWYRSRLRELTGPIPPPANDLDATLARVAKAGASLQRELERQIDPTIEDIIATQESPERVSMPAG